MLNMNKFSISCKIYNLNTGDVITKEHINKKYKEFALKEHPDKSTNPNATERFKKLKASYDFLNQKIKNNNVIVPEFIIEPKPEIKSSATFWKREEFNFEDILREEYREEYAEQRRLNNIKKEKVNSIIHILRENSDSLDKYTNDEIYMYVEKFDVWDTRINGSKNKLKNYIKEDILKPLWRTYGSRD